MRVLYLIASVLALVLFLPALVSAGEPQAALPHDGSSSGALTAQRLLLRAAHPGPGAPDAPLTEPGMPGDSPQRITHDPANDLSPTLAVGGDGRTYLAWIRRSAAGAPAQVLWARSPAWAQSQPLAFLRATGAPARLAITAQPRLALAWSQQATSTQAICFAVAEEGGESCTPKLPAGSPSAFGLDRRGSLHAVWVNQGTINHWTSSQGITSSVPISGASRIEAITLAIDAQARTHVVWASTNSLGQSNGITYAVMGGAVTSGESPALGHTEVGAFLSGTQPVLLSSDGRRPRIRLVGDEAHVAWIAGSGLYYANSRKWLTPTLVAQGLGPSAPFAIAVSRQGVARLAWYDGTALWSASAADWFCSRREIATAPAMLDLDMVVDRFGATHLAWAAPSFASRDSDIYYIELNPAAPQLAITQPRDGSVLRDDTWVRVETNTGPGAILAVAFYLESRGQLVDGPSWSEAGWLPSGSLEPASEADAPWLLLGYDRDGRDGWGLLLRTAELAPMAYHRVVALAWGPTGAITRGLSGWFSAQPAATPWVLLGQPVEEPLRSQAWLPTTIVASPTGGRKGQLPQRAELYLAPGRVVAPIDGATSANRLPAVSSFWPEPTYIGSFPLPSDPATGWEGPRFDSRRIPDGSYRPVLVLTGESGTRSYSIFPGPIEVANSALPRVEITAPEPGIVVSGALRAVVSTEGAGGLAQRVDFFLERDRSLGIPGGSDSAAALQVPERVWLGSDGNGVDGWSLDVPVDGALDGDGWHLRAVAFDDRGLSTSARSAHAFSILGRERALLQITSPLPQSVLRGTALVELVVITRGQQVLEVAAYAQDPDGALSYIGPMRRSAGSWAIEWDTRTLGDGTHSLLAIGHTDRGAKSLARIDGLQVRNMGPHLEWTQPAEDAVLWGPARVVLEGGEEFSSSLQVRVYYQDAAGSLHPLGTGRWSQQAWCLVWDTSTALDGVYQLVALVTDSQGGARRLSRRVALRNYSPSIVWAQTWKGVVCRGTRPIAWRTQQPTGEPISVTVEYSPNRGAQWMPVATNITATSSFSWNSMAFPDSDTAMLRLTVTDGTHHGQAVSEQFRVDNANQPPEIALRAPRPASPYGSPLLISWYSRDPEADPLTVAIDYRRGDGSWIPVARQLPDRGSYLWDTASLLPGADYGLRVTVTDRSNAPVSTVVEGLTLAGGHVPQVVLLWPNGPTLMRGEGVVLWQATDADGDDLTIDLYYSDDAGETWLPLAEGIPNSGYYVWQVSYLPVGTNYRIRVAARDALFQSTDVSDGVFAIGPGTLPHAHVLSPVVGESLSGLRLVRWSSAQRDGRPSAASVWLRRAGAQEWQLLTAGAFDDGFCLWDTQRYVDGFYQVRVVVSNSVGMESTLLPQPVSVANQANRPPRVTLLSPRGGEFWSGEREITWQAWDPDDALITATLSLSHDGGETWTPLAAVDARAGGYLWDTRLAPPGKRYVLRITVSDGATSVADRSASDFYLAERPGHPPFVAFLSPDSSGNLQGDNKAVWVADDGDEDLVQLTLAVSDDDGIHWRILAGDLPKTGSLFLGEPLFHAGLSYRLRLQATDGQYHVEARSPSFALNRPAARTDDPALGLRIEAPGSDQVLSATAEVRWQASGVSLDAQTRVEISADGMQTWKLLADNLRAADSYLWDTRQLANGAYALRVTVDDGHARLSQTREGIHIANVGRNAPVISLLSPRPGDVWTGMREVRWRCWDADAVPSLPGRSAAEGELLTVGLAFSLDRGANWLALGAPLAGTESYLWDTTALPNCTQVLLRAEVTDGIFTSYHVTEGTFAIFNAHSPSTILTNPRGGERWAGRQRLAWYTAQGPDAPSQVRLELSLDMGRTWQVVADGLPGTGSLEWDAHAVADGSRALFRVLATQGLHRAINATWPPVTIVGNRPDSTLQLYAP